MLASLSQPPVLWDGALYITLTNLARVDHSSAASRVISLRVSERACAKMRRDHRESPCQEYMLLRQQSEVTSFTGQMDEVILPSHSPECTSLHRTQCSIPKPSAASVSILQLKYDSKCPGPCQINENDPGAGVEVKGRATDDGP